MIIKARVRRTLVALMVACLIWPTTLMAQDAIDESPNEFAMVADLLVARPIGLVFTVAGAAVWVVSLPFTLLSGHAGEAAGQPIARSWLSSLIVSPMTALLHRIRWPNLNC